MISSLPRHNLYKFDTIVFQFQAGQSSRCVGASVDIDTVRTNIRLRHRRVSVDDDFTEFIFAKKKVLSNPQQVFFALLCQWNAWSYASMDEKEISASK